MTMIMMIKMIMKIKTNSNNEKSLCNKNDTMKSFSLQRSRKLKVLTKMETKN